MGEKELKDLAELGGKRAIGAAKKVFGLLGCRIGSLYCPTDFLEEQFASLFEERVSS
jgi:hypothetical protein